MTPASARALRRRRVADLRAAEPDLSLRQMADRLGISRDTVTRDLEALDREAADIRPPAEAPDGPVADSAPQVSEGDDVVAETGTDQVDEAGRRVAEDRPPAGSAAADLVADAAPPRLPRRIRSGEELVIDLSRSPALRRDLAVLEATGLSPEVLVAKAVAVLRFGHEQAVRAGRLRPGDPFVALDVTVGPPPAGLRRPAPASGP
ncbi:helix-turn-helix domain-containing protein [Streptomyces sp. NPDC091972]|uniref:helix-turn-helix domain-containing protein n=1 Tax=Streptomyces sp. NPDC091972 TaxID=3366007 RepID=UPI0038229C92